ncbi:MAG: sulfotransferase [Halioglobus sp.]
MKKKKQKPDKTLLKRVLIKGIRGQSQELTIGDAINLASGAYEKNLYDRAELVLEQVIATADNCSLAWLNLAQIYLVRLKYKEAKLAANKVASLEQRNVRMLLDSASILSALQSEQSALSTLERLIKLSPNNGEAFSLLGDIYGRLDQKEKALSCLKRAVKLHPDKARMLWNLTAYSPSTAQNYTREMERILEKETTNEHAQALTLFSLAKINNHQKKYHEEYEHLIKANHLINQNHPWNEEIVQSNLNIANQLIPKMKSFTPPCHSSINSTPILICALPRSGTTLIERILGSHSMVTATGESNIMNGAIMRQSEFLFKDVFFAKGLNQSNLDTFTNGASKIANETIEAFSITTQYFVDKTIANVWSVGPSLLTSPNAKAIYIERNPADIFISCFQHVFGNGINYAYSPDDFIAYYNVTSALMERWRSTFPERILTIKYEDLVLEQKKVTQKLLDFCNLDWEEACLQFHKSSGSVHTASVTQVRQKLYSSSSEKWRKYVDVLPQEIIALAELYS